MGGGSVSTPPDRNYAAESRSNLQAQVQLAPQLFAARANEDYGDPAQTRLALSTLDTALFGGGDTEGLLSLYGRARPQLQQWERDALRTQRGDDITAIGDYAGASREALRKANPDNASLIDTLNQQAQHDLGLGAELDPREMRRSVQGTLGSLSGRGFGQGSNNDLLMAAMAAYGGGQDVQNQRRAFAGQVAGLNQAFYGDPFQQVLGRPSQTTNQLMNLGQQGAGQQRTNTFLNPETAYGQDVFNTNYNANAASRIASANNSAAITGAAIGAAGSVGSSL
jgi:hypothetical protein